MTEINSFKKTFQIIFYFIQAIFVIIFSFIISTDYLWAEETSDEEDDEWMYEEDENGDPLIGIEFLTTPHGVSDDYEHISKTYEETEEESKTDSDEELIFKNTSKYIGSSIDLMISHAANLQYEIQGLNWLDKNSNLSLLTYVNDELEFLTSRKETLLALTETETLKSSFSEVRKDWIAFRAEIKLMVNKTLTESMDFSCGKVSTEEYVSWLDSDEELYQYAKFEGACEDWGRIENIELSDTLLELIKVVD